MMWWNPGAFPRLVVLVSMTGAGFHACGCGGNPEVAPENRIVKVNLDAADRAAIMDERFASIRAGLIEIRLLEADRPDPELDRDAYAAHADRVDEQTRQVIAMMADERWTRDERRLMQRVLRFATAEDLAETPVAPDGVDHVDG
ncbi:MAG: hypothetical protein RLZZ461_895 [Planctomycetota bacterium]|jgi:hypothetical protein